MRRGTIMAGVASSLVALVVLGCSTVARPFQSGETVVQYDADGSTPILMDSTTGGRYALYQAGSLDPKVVVNLESGEQLGFERSDTGQLIAIAGDQEVPLSPSESYSWKRR